MDTPRLRTVDASTDRPFGDNPAGLVLLERAQSPGWTAGLAVHLTATAAPRDLAEQAG